jgi:hypothetical protein
MSEISIDKRDKVLAFAAIVEVATGLALIFALAGNSSAVRGMLTYNSLTAMYLTYLGTLGHLRGILLWPAVALHAVVALLLIWTGRAR